MVYSSSQHLMKPEDGSPGSCLYHRPGSPYSHCHCHSLPCPHHKEKMECTGHQLEYPLVNTSLENHQQHQAILTTTISIGVSIWIKISAVVSIVSISFLAATHQTLLTVTIIVTVTLPIITWSTTSTVPHIEES